MEVLYCNDFPYEHKTENFKKTGSLWLSEATKVGFSEVLLRIRQWSVITDGTKKEKVLINELDSPLIIWKHIKTTLKNHETNDNNNYNNNDDQDN